MSEVLFLDPPADLAESSLDAAVKMLGEPVSMVVCSTQNAPVVAVLRSACGVFCAVVPDKLLASPYAWAIFGEKRIVISLAPG